MKFSERYRDAFDSIIRSRGRDYFLTGRVSPSTVDQALTTFTVAGSVTYRVFLDPDCDTPQSFAARASCNCPYYRGGRLCKHVWAALLQLDAEASGGTKPRAASTRSPAGSPAAGSSADETYLAYYFISVSAWRASSHFAILPIQILQSTGEATARPWKTLEEKRISLVQLDRYRDPRDQKIIGTLLTLLREPRYGFFRTGNLIQATFARQENLLDEILGTGRAYFHESTELAPAMPNRRSTVGPLARIAGGPLELEIGLERKSKGDYRPRLWLKSAEAEVPLTRRPLIFADRWIVVDAQVGELRNAAAAARAFDAFFFEAVERIPAAEVGTWLERWLKNPGSPRIRWNETLGWREVIEPPKPRALFTPSISGRAHFELAAEFEYGGRAVGHRDPSKYLISPDLRVAYRRDLKAEHGFLERLGDDLPDPVLRERWLGSGFRYALKVEPSHFAELATALRAHGWDVLAAGRRLREMRDFEVGVRSGIDWFDLDLKLNFGEVSSELPELLNALRRNDGMIELGDGTVGLLPAEWRERYAPLVRLGTAVADPARPGERSVRFPRIQALLLDAWLGEEQNLRADSGFRLFRRKLEKFRGIEKLDAPAGFRGKLRGYQREGLAWFNFLEEYGTGGILADDMGLGKTIQLLAFIERRREARSASKPHRPCLVIVPKSLVFNWINEAARFVPDLRVLHYGSGDRAALRARFAGVDLVVMTYARLRQDITELRLCEFDLAIADEAQVIKNPSSQTAKACKLIRAESRFAMTGTPIENSLRDLFSILEFTSPGLIDFAHPDDLGEDARAQLRRALRPFILRRTKGNVLKELPPKTEQVLLCEMSGQEKKLYEGLRTHLRAQLAGRIQDEGLGKTKFHVLEALLRLRQAACHPGLLDPRRAGETSSKLDSLVDTLRQVAAEGHKALVFSQFTRFLHIVRDRLRAEGFVCEYLDGKTQDREARVRRFQEDPACGIFLISLKAGGVGLNLTAASYVFLLDPWWNPAVETQAIDRAHRMGQNRKITAYRLITRGSIEEKVLELQKGKRELAEAIIGEDRGFLRRMTREDLELLLS